MADEKRAHEAIRYDVREVPNEDGTVGYEVIAVDVRLDEQPMGVYRSREQAQAAIEALTAARQAAQQIMPQDDAEQPPADQGDASDASDANDTPPVDQQQPTDDEQQQATEARIMRAIAALSPRDLVGSEWEVVVIQEGRSANNFVYPAEVLQRDAHVFEGAPVAVTWQALDHHHEVGTLRAVETRVIDGRTAIVARAVIDDVQARERLTRAYLDGRPYEFSIDAQVRAIEGDDGAVRVTQIVAPRELTIVQQAAAGGRVLRAVAGAGGPDAEDGAMSAKLADELRRVQEAREQAERMAFELRLEQTLRAVEGLPEPALDAVREAFKDRVGTDAEIQAEIKRQRDLVTKVAESLGVGQVRGCGTAQAQVGPGRHEKMRIALEGLFRNRDLEVDGVKVERFRSIRRAIEAWHGDARMDPYAAFAACKGGRTQHQRMLALEAKGAPRTIAARESANTTTFADALADVINKILLEGYALDDRMEILRTLAGRNYNRRPITDFRAQYRKIFGGYGNLPPVAEGATYPTLTSPSDSSVSFQIAKRGGLEDLTMELIANDDVGVIARIPDELRMAAVETLFQTVLDVIANNSNIGDGSPLFRTGNKTSSAFSKAALDAARQAMRSQTRPNDTKVLGSRNLPRLWLGPNELEETIFVISRSQARVGETADLAAPQQPNLHSGIDYRIIDYWTDANDCCVVADPNMMDTVEIGFWQGREEPELFVQDQPNVGSMFDADKVTYKIRHIWGFEYLDHRPFYGFSRA